MRRASYLSQAGDEAGAAQERTQAAARPPTTAFDFFLAGEEHHQQGQLVEAGDDFEAALRLQPDHFWSRYFLAVCRLKQHRFPEARAHLTAALSQQPDFPWIYLLRGYALGESQEYAGAETDFRRAWELGSNRYARYGVLVNRGSMRLRQGKIAAAVQDLEQAVVLLPDLYQAHVNLALAYQKQKKYTAALAALDRAMQRAPLLPAPYRLRAQLHRERDDCDAALRDLDEAIRREPPGSRLLAEDHFERGRLLHRQKRPHEALAAYDAVLKIDPDHGAVQRLRADTLMALGRGPQALAALDRYLATGKGEAAAYRQRGFERARQGQLAGALADYTRALELEPQSPTSAGTRARRGWALLDLPKSARQALADFEQAILTDPDQADLYNGRGYARVLLGEYRTAVSDAEEALRRGRSAAAVRERLSLAYNAACIYAQAAGQVRRAAGAPRHEELARQYEGRAAELLSSALDLLPPALRGRYLEQALADPAFVPIRNHPDLRKLAAAHSRTAR